MSDEDILHTLTRIADQRQQTEAVLADLTRQERETIAAAWRAGIPPTKTATAAKRTPAHVRNLRPDDVPPARLGGGAAPKRRGRKR